MLEKIQQVLKYFCEHSEKVALLWRPHPLLENTIKVMRPLLWKKYVEIVQHYKEAGWGIFDETSDLNRAIMISDAYYGDWSSVVQLYKKTGKLIMIQHID